MTAQTHIVKRARHVEAYDKRKLFASIYASCLSVRTPAGEAELTAERICKDIIPWLSSKVEVTSADIRRRAAKHFVIYNPDAAYMYENQKLIT